MVETHDGCIQTEEGQGPGYYPVLCQINFHHRQVRRISWFSVLQLHNFRNVRSLCNGDHILFVIKRREIKKFSKALEQKLGVKRRKYGKCENGGLAVQVFLYFCKPCPGGLAISQVVQGVPAALERCFMISFAPS